MAELLKEFEEITDENRASILPRSRDIEHQIDFIPGSILPNLLHYRLSPREAIILQQQVDELLKSGPIRTGRSPCAVPALLVLKKMETTAINKITIKYRFPIPRIDDILYDLAGSYFLL